METSSALRQGQHDIVWGMMHDWAGFPKLPFDFLRFRKGLLGLNSFNRFCDWFNVVTSPGFSGWA